ncbi:LysR family transcriptional regulator [Streptomyces sp. Da 82-17]|uniref:LysR family transcriptional regulator n=1 Tax=Streptomyces sp. Da 82-17 TaxID=3377116 RepID=UPI0038D3CC0B
MELRQLRCVVAVAEELHFGRAAKRLHMAQAPLSAQIQRIERELGHRLFERTTRSVRLTAVGEEFYRRALDILARVDETTADLQAVADGRAGTLRVGFASSASYSVLPQAVRRFRQAAPGVDLQLVPLTSAEQAEQLHEGRLDLGLVRGESGALDLRTERLFEERLVACLPADHALSAEAEVSPQALADEPMIFFPARDMPGYVSEIRPVFAGLPFPRVRTRVVHQETALGFVAAGMGFTVLPESVSSFRPAAVHVARITGDPKTVMCAAFPDTELSPAAERFREALRTSEA